MRENNRAPILKKDRERDDAHQRQDKNQRRKRDDDIQRANESGKQADSFAWREGKMERAWLADQIGHRNLQCVGLDGHVAKNSSSHCLFREIDYDCRIARGGVDDAQTKFALWQRLRRNARNVVHDRPNVTEIAT
ncbi:MAG TPA: hypothetical protein VG328_01635 [Stellaceae bacterium]|nr:hypothetical protein [Stellaceae bacterium]